MKWYGISGSRVFNLQVEKDVVNLVRRVIFSDGGIVVGGALGVDFIATDTVMNVGDHKNPIRMYIPSSF